jgi:hypothetical protein
MYVPVDYAVPVPDRVDERDLRRAGISLRRVSTASEYHERGCGPKAVTGHTEQERCLAG